MAAEEYSFEHAEGFEQGELAGQVTLGKFEAHYEEIFAEVIEDGVITAEERARLHKAADALGLDRVRLRSLEEALQAAYEARHHVRVREVSDDDEPPASIVLSPQAAKDPRLAVLEVRVRELEGQVAEAHEGARRGALAGGRRGRSVEPGRSSPPRWKTFKRAPRTSRAACEAIRETSMPFVASIGSTDARARSIGNGSWRRRSRSSAPPTRRSARPSTVIASTA